MALFNKKSDPEKEKVALARIVQELDRIYSNKSGDEYKMHGDITKSPVYNSIQRCVADLKSIKGFNKNSGEAEIIIAKHRNGPTATIKLVFKDEYATFLPMDKRFN